MEWGECKCFHHSKGDNGRTENKISCYYSSSLYKLHLLKMKLDRHSFAFVWAFSVKTFILSLGYYFKTFFFFWCGPFLNSLLNLFNKELKSWLIGRDAGARKDWRQKKGAAEDEIDSITNSMGMNLSKVWETVKDRGAGWAAAHGVAE